MQEKSDSHRAQGYYQLPMINFNFIKFTDLLKKKNKKKISKIE